MGLWPLASDGTVDFDTTGAAITTRRNGFAFTAAGKLAATTATTVAYVQHGMAFAADGRLIVVSGGAVHHIHNGLGLDASERVIVGTSGNKNPRNGHNLDDSGRIRSSGVS